MARVTVCAVVYTYCILHIHYIFGISLLEACGIEKSFGAANTVQMLFYSEQCPLRSRFQ